MVSISTRRRELLKGTGAAVAGAVGLSGCTGNNGEATTTTESGASQKTTAKEDDGGGGGGDDLQILTVASGRTGSGAMVNQIIKNNRLDRKHGVVLDMSWTSVPAAEQRVVNKQAEAAFMSVIGGAKLNMQDSDMRLLFPLSGNNESLVVRKDADISMDSLEQALKDMQDLTIGTLSPSSTAHTAMRVLFNNFGYNIDQYDIRTGPPPVLTGLTQKGELDGMINVMPRGAELVASGDYKRVFAYNDAVKEAIGNPISQTNMAAYQKTFEEKPEAFKGWMKAYYEASAKVAKNPTKYYKEYMDLMGLKSEKHLEIAAEYTKQHDLFKSEFSEALLKGDKELLNKAFELGVLEGSMSPDNIAKEMFQNPQNL